MKAAQYAVICVVTFLLCSVWPDGASSQNQAADPTGLVGKLGSSRFFQPDSDGIHRFFPQDGFIRLRGWIDGGYTYNTAFPTSGFNGPYNSVYRDTGQLNQLYLIAERPLRDTSRGWDIGGRVDVFFGLNYFLPQSKGLEREPDGEQRWNDGDYGVVIPQAYAEVGNNTFGVKLGHFYTIIGYEGVHALKNFFYSKSYSYQFGGPFTHWGGLATWNLTKSWTLQGGIVNGWDALNRVHDHPAALVNLKYTASSDLWSLAFALISGEEQAAAPIQFEMRTRYSAIFTVNPHDRVEYVVHHFYAYQEDGRLGGGTARWYGIDQYLYYKFTDQWRAGLRFEWFRDEAGTRVGGAAALGNPNQAPFPGSFYSLTVGLNYRPHPNFLLRPEIRKDWFDGTRLPYNDGTDTGQLLLAVDAIVQF